MTTHTLGEKFRAVLATGRMANLPTVWSNVLMAFFLADSTNISNLSYYVDDYGHFYYWLLGFTMVAASCLYVGACMLGDYRDIRFDREHRPGRPIPTGVLSPGFVALTAISLITLGLIAGAVATPAALVIAFEISYSNLKSASARDLQVLLQPDQLTLLGVLIVLIVVYALFHKKSRPLALINMALCRTQLVIYSSAMAIPVFFFSSGDISFHGSWVSAPLLIVGFSVGIYTLLLSSVAATESNKNKIKYSSYLKMAMLFLPLGAVTLILSAGSSETSIVTTGTSRAFFFSALLIYSCWMLFAFRALPNDKPAFVSRALAGFCLLDACFASAYSVTIPLICILLFGLALLLQKIAPAT